MKKINRVEVIEVGARDGLQNESRIKLLPTHDFLETRFRFVCSLADAGFKEIEAGAFVRPDLVPQMASTGLLLKRIQAERPDLWKAKKFWVLVPNLRGLEDAVNAGAKHIALFTATSESFNKRNIRMSVAESMTQIKAIMNAIAGTKLRARGYISTVWGCPYEGSVKLSKARKMAEQLFELGVDEVSLGDTIGVATPNRVTELLKLFPKSWALAGHFHDTRGTALANAMAAMEWGIRRLDSSAGGIGGCPYAPGAAGNLATEDLLYLLQGMKIKTGVDLTLVCEAAEALARTLELPPLPSRFHKAWLANGK